MPRILPDSVVAAGHVSREILAGVSFRFARARGGEPQVAEFQAQGLPGDPQEQGGLVLTPTGVLQDARQQEPVQVAVRLGVEVADVGAQPQADEELLDPRLLARRGRGGRGQPSEGLREEGRQEDVAAGPQQGLLEDALQLPDVARPGVGAQPLQRLRGGLAARRAPARGRNGAGSAG